MNLEKGDVSVLGIVCFWVKNHNAVFEGFWEIDMN